MMRRFLENRELDDWAFVDSGEIVEDYASRRESSKSGLAHSGTSRGWPMP